MQMNRLRLILMLTIMNCASSSAQWTTLNTGRSIWPDGIAFFGLDSGVIVTTNHSLILTTDAGTTWNEHVPQSGMPCGIGSFLSIDAGWTGGEIICRTTDGGKTWDSDTNSEIGLPQPEAVQTIYFRDSLNGFEGSGYFSIFGTTDGGKTWQVRYRDTAAAFSDDYVYKIQFCSPAFGIALAGNRLETYVLR